MASLLGSIRVALLTLVICVAAYPALIWGVGQAFTRDTAEGSLIRAADGRVLGSRLIAQKFAEPRYFWPRPSAVDYNAASAGASNKAPTSADLTRRAAGLVAEYGATAADPLPPELAAASGSGLDPHISEGAALYQAQRVAAARGLPASRVEALIHQHAFSPGGILTPDRLVNVLELNLALDRLGGKP